MSWCYPVYYGVIWELHFQLQNLQGRSVTIPAQLAARIDTITDHRHVTSNRVILDLIEDGIAALRPAPRRVSGINGAISELHGSGRNRTAPGRTYTDDVRRLMPEIQWTKLSKGVKHHLMDRLKDRRITASDLQALQEWIAHSPPVPSGKWYKNFGTFISSAERVIHL